MKIERSRDLLCGGYGVLDSARTLSNTLRLRSGPESRSSDPNYPIILRLTIDTGIICLMFYHKLPVEVYFVYILLCNDLSYYTGLTDDLDFRYFHHQIGEYPTCYTFKRRPVTLQYFETIRLLDQALKREGQIEKWSRAKKKALIEANLDKLKSLATCFNFTHWKYKDIDK